MPARRDDPPQWRLAFAVLDVVCDRQWRPFLRIFILIVLLMTTLVVLVSAGPVASGITALVTVAAVTRTRRRRSTKSR